MTRQHQPAQLNGTMSSNADLDNVIIIIQQSYWVAPAAINNNADINSGRKIILLICMIH
jgi:hypothetical protein